MITVVHSKATVNFGGRKKKEKKKKYTYLHTQSRTYAHEL